MSSFRTRLAAAAKAAAFTDADLAVWLDCAYATVRAWRQGRHEPLPAIRPQLDTRLSWLERATKARKFPVALGVRQKDRGIYILAVRKKYE